MKRILFLLSICLSIFSFSQNIHIGPELGMNMVKVETSQIGNNYQPGWHAGLNFEYDFNDWLSIKSGVFYTQKRQGYSSADTSEFALIGLLGLGSIQGVDFNTYTKTNGRFTQNFVQIPILASFKWEDFSLNVGGYIGYQFSSRTKQLETSYTPFVSTIDLSSLDQTGFLGSLLPPASSETFTESSNDGNLRQLDYGLKMGLSYQMKHLSLNGHYLLGLPDYRLSQGENAKQVHKYFQLSLMYAFDFGKQSNKNHSRFN